MVTDVLLGDNNTRYFQMVPNGKHRKKRIFSLEHDNGKIEGQANYKSYITQFYKELSGHPDENFFLLEEHRTEDIPQFGHSENAFLMAPFTEKEIRKEFLTWNRTRHLDLMDSQLNFIRNVGRSLNKTS